MFKSITPLVDVELFFEQHQGGKLDPFRFAAQEKMQEHRHQCCQTSADQKGKREKRHTEREALANEKILPLERFSLRKQAEKMKQ